MKPTLAALSAVALALPFHSTVAQDATSGSGGGGPADPLTIEIQLDIEPTAEPILPLPSASLEIGAGRSNLAELVGQISDLTGVAVRATAPTLGRLAESPTGLVADVTVEPEHAWSFFESLIAQEGFRLVELRGSNPRLMAILDSYGDSRTAGAMFYRTIDVSELDRYAEHHALLIETVVHLEHIDVRQLSNSLRSMVPGGSTLSLVPAGNTGSLLVQGTGANVAELARMLRAVEAAEKRMLEKVLGSKTEPDGDATTEAAEG